MDNTFYVVSNVRHNGRDYRRGDTIVLEASDALLASGAIQQEPLSTETIAATPVQEPEADRAPEVGGSVTQTGEPSIDGEQGKAGDDAADVTEEVSERMTRPELEERARQAGVAEETIAAAPNKGALVEAIAASKQPSEDLSANL